MPSKIVTANTTVQSVAAEEGISVHKPISITVDNSGGSGDRTIKVQDIFTPAETEGDDSPTEQTVDRWQATVLQGDVETYDEKDLEGVKCLGELGVIADAIDASCSITVGYKTE
jgi:hypothetical protein